jgi:hypothetical protein
VEENAGESKVGTCEVGGKAGVCICSHRREGKQEFPGGHMEC